MKEVKKNEVPITSMNFKQQKYEAWNIMFTEM